MTTRTHYSVAPIAPTSGRPVWPIVRTMLIIVAALFVVVPTIRWAGEWRASRQVAAPTVQLTTGVETVRIATGLTEYPNLTLTVTAVTDGWRITDEDGDKGWCPRKPATLADLEHCRHTRD